MAGLPTTRLGERFLTHAGRCATSEVSAYLMAGGNALLEIGFQAERRPTRTSRHRLRGPATPLSVASTRNALH